MPIMWDDTKQAKLLALIFNICDVRPTEAQKVEIAARIGSGCTPKVISHRIIGIRKAGAKDMGADSSTTFGNASSGFANLTPAVTPAVTPKKTASKPKKVPGGLPRRIKKEAIPDDGNDGDDSDTLALVHTTPPDSGHKRKFGMPNMKSAENMEFSKRERSSELNFTNENDITVGEEVGEGLRAKKVEYDEEL